jgi:hypothetical protein
MANCRGEQRGNDRLIRLLGQGGFAAVYLGAAHTSNCRFHSEEKATGPIIWACSQVVYSPLILTYS